MQGSSLTPAHVPPLCACVLCRLSLKLSASDIAVCMDDEDQVDDLEEQGPVTAPEIVRDLKGLLPKLDELVNE